MDHRRMCIEWLIDWKVVLKLSPDIRALFHMQNRMKVQQFMNDYGSPVENYQDRGSPCYSKAPAPTPLEEQAQLDKDLLDIFNKFKDGTTAGKLPGITYHSFVNFAKERKLIDDKLSQCAVDMIFHSTKVGKKEELDFEHFQTAVRKMAVKKNIPYKQLVQHAACDTVTQLHIDYRPKWSWLLTEIMIRWF